MFTQENQHEILKNCCSLAYKQRGRRNKQTLSCLLKLFMEKNCVAIYYSMFPARLKSDKQRAFLAVLLENETNFFLFICFYLLLIHFFCEPTSCFISSGCNRKCLAQVQSQVQLVSNMSYDISVYIYKRSLFITGSYC